MSNAAEIKVKKLRDDAKLPVRGSAAAAGADLCACSDGETIIVAAGETVFIHTGIAVEIPDGFVGLIFARSGLSTKRGLAPANKVGVIDSDYRGEIIVALHNHGAAEQVIERGERIAQLVIMPYAAADYSWAEELSDTSRGEGGFGSTGRK